MAVIAIIAVLVFAAVFFYSSSRKTEGSTLIENSLLVKSADPVAGIRQRLPEEKVYLEARLYAANDTRNSMLAIMTSEIARSLALQRKNVTTYAIVDGGENICGDTGCKGAAIVVQSGGCNCMRFDGNRIFVEGDNKFLVDQSVRVGRLFGFALYKK